ncbi:MAG: hypothetical protein SW833_13695 [Cyanobacteriota bacterium]|nr:hypothetical protein [Cyanobacteriota bacterium]
MRISSRYLQLFLLFLCGLVGVGAIALVHPPVQAQQITQATVVEILDGDQVYIQNRKARNNSTARRGEQIRTGSARAALRLNNNAGLRLGKNSSLIVGERCVQIKRGRVLIGGQARGCLGSVVAVTRGTLYLIEQNESNIGQVTVLEGTVAVSDREDPGRPPVILREQEKVTVFPQGVLGPIEQMSVPQFSSLVQGIEELLYNFRVSLPSLEAFNNVLRDLGLTPASPAASSSTTPIPGLW